MSTIWPPELQQYVEVGVQERVEVQQLRSPMSKGPAKVRPDSTRAKRFYVCQMHMTADDMERFDQFYVTDTEQGTAEFDWLSPRKNTPETLRFVSCQPYLAIFNDLWQISFELEVIS